ncbi:hypothetical protein C1O24_12200 [Vibrio diazotrophicus]|nr:hypothetical protein C1O24_12200 [Vibrio diazotrophicus]
MQLLAKLKREIIDTTYIFRWITKKEAKRNNDASALSEHLKKDIGLSNEVKETELYSKFL